VAVLRFSQKAAHHAGAIDEADLKSLTEAGLSADEIFEVLATIQIFSAVNLFTDVAAVELDNIS
jgi:alkylhydroperoxidase family enzyme